MPTILLRADPGDRPPDVLLVEEPETAERAAGLLDGGPGGSVLMGTHRGLAAFRGHWHGHPVTIQTTGLGAPSVAMVVEELLMTGARRLVRVATAMAVAPWMRLGEAIVVLAAAPADGASRTYLGGLPMAPIADFGVTHALVHEARAAGIDVSVGGVATVDVLPDRARLTELAARGILAADLGTAPLFVLAARAAAGERPAGGHIRAAALLCIDQLAPDDEPQAGGALPDRLLSVALDALTGTPDR